MDQKVSAIWMEVIKSEIDRKAFVEKMAEKNFDGQRVRIDQIERIWDAAHMTARELVKASGLTQAGFATRYCIALPTVEAWCRGLRNPPEYAKLLLVLDLRLI